MPASLPAAVYAQDRVEIGQHLQLIGGVRYDPFDFASTDRRSLATGARTDNLVSPRIGAVLKPWDTLSAYASYSVSYLPPAGDSAPA
ncbi:hypothetical protein VQ03_17465 [Methylobacterium tarhaniae]|uniref:TonB-dependent receptor-like beta-barrel domain-containing protein n=1 Tax=Methylobacterium tarhaniae TaxID=1187852 RepID=A0A0J6SXN6_9HYPH|nr:TonB-dependent receptor [Methylobacterium tarhaniae]KMO38357.1 hypothetical protein VQ03_17465 [Methylobacterium tarhaniae]